MSELQPAGGLDELLRERGLDALDLETTQHFEEYLALILRWNARINLTAIRDTQGILARHFVESIACARALPAGIAALLDFGSGAGLPGLPIALCRREISVTLAESQGKKAAFLREVVRALGIPVRVHSGRAEDLGRGFDCVVLRAVDKMLQAVAVASKLVTPGGWLALMITAAQVPGLQAAAGPAFRWREAIDLPGGENQILALGRLQE